jgi:hypothetical protein
LSCFNIIGSYWDRKGENEIDIAAVNDMDKILLLGECKLNPKKIDTWKLEKRSEVIVNHFKNYKVYYRGFYPGMLTRFLESPESHLFS